MGWERLRGRERNVVSNTDRLHLPFSLATLNNSSAIGTHFCFRCHSPHSPAYAGASICAAATQAPQNVVKQSTG